MRGLGIGDVCYRGPVKHPPPWQLARRLSPSGQEDGDPSTSRRPRGADRSAAVRVPVYPRRDETSRHLVGSHALPDGLGSGRRDAHQQFGEIAATSAIAPHSGRRSDIIFISLGRRRSASPGESTA